MCDYCLTQFILKYLLHKQRLSLYELKRRWAEPIQKIKSCDLGWGVRALICHQRWEYGELQWVCRALVSFLLPFYPRCPKIVLCFLPGSDPFTNPPLNQTLKIKEETTLEDTLTHLIKAYTGELEIYLISTHTQSCVMISQCSYLRGELGCSRTLSAFINEAPLSPCHS